MNGKIVLVTGSNGGLGVHVTQAFLDAGATVIGTSRKIQRSDFDSPSFTAVPGEMSTSEGASSLVQQVLALSKRIDVLAHTVGGFAGGQSIAETDDATFQRMFDLNLNSAFYLLRAALPAMRKTGNGRIIAIGSRAALEPGPGVGAYSASKAALVSLIRTVAAENKDVGITANVILPGTIDTPVNRKMIPNADVSKWVQPANVASLVVWLASDAGADVNGAVILAKKPEAELQRSREVSVWAAACSGVRIALLAGVFLHHYREFPSYLLPIQAGRVKVSGGWQKLPADLSARSRLATSYRWQPRCFPTRQTKWRATGYTENFGQR